MADEDIFLCEVARPGATGGNISAPDWSTIRSDVDTNIATLASLTLGASLTNVADSVDSAANGKILGRAAGVWTEVDPTTGILIEEFTTIPVTVNPAATILTFGNGVEAVQDGLDPDRVYINALYGGTGSAVTVSRTDHTHSPTIMSVTDIAATGTISSGTRTLVTANFGPLLNGVVYDLEAEGFIVIRNDVNNGTVELRLQVNGGTIKTFSAPNVGGVPSGFSIKQIFATATGTGANVTIIFSLAYISGDASDIRNGQLFIKAHPRR